MTPLRLVVVCSAALLCAGPTAAQPPVAPPPHLALDEVVKEYKRLGLPLPPANAELVRLRLHGFYEHPDHLAFRIPPAKPGEDTIYLIGCVNETLVMRAEPVKPGSDIPAGVEPEYVSDLLCLAVQCRERGLNESARLYYARAQEAITSPVPARMGLAAVGPIRVNGWALRTDDASALKELRHVASTYWNDQITARDRDRADVLRYLKEFEPGRKDDIRALELTVAPRKSKPGTVEFLIDDLIDYWPVYTWAFEPLDEKERGAAAYRKLVELGFDAVPALLEHVADERFTRYEYSETFLGKVPSFHKEPVRVGHIVGHILNALSGGELTKETGPQTVDEKKARAWWEKARKEGEEKWLVALVTREPGRELSVGWVFANGLSADRVIFRALGAKYPARLGEFYRTILVKHPQRKSDVLADEVAASKLPRAEKLALLVEGAEHKNLVYRNVALAVLSRFDPPLFRKHLLATLKQLPPTVVRTRSSDPLSDLAALVWQTNDPACWDALAVLAKQSGVYDRIEIIKALEWPRSEGDKATQRELLRFLLRFLSDDAATTFFGQDGAERVGQRVWDVAAEVLTQRLGLEARYPWYEGGLERLLFRAAVAELAAEELERLKK